MLPNLILKYKERVSCVIRGTTAQFRFKLPYAKRELAWATMKFWQPGNDGTPLTPLPITKRLEHCSAPEGSYELCVNLTAEETLRFTDRLKARVQLRAQTLDGATFGSRETLISVYPMNDDIVTDNPTLPEPDSAGLIIFDGKSIAE